MKITKICEHDWNLWTWPKSVNMTKHLNINWQRQTFTWWTWPNFKLLATTNCTDFSSKVSTHINSIDWEIYGLSNTMTKNQKYKKYCHNGQHQQVNLTENNRFWSSWTSKRSSLSFFSHAQTTRVCWFWSYSNWFLVKLIR